MKKIVKTNNAPISIDAPIVLTPEQIVEIAAGTAIHAGGTTTSGIIKAAQ